MDKDKATGRLKAEPTGRANGLTEPRVDCWRASPALLKVQVCVERERKSAEGFLDSAPESGANLQMVAEPS